MVLKKVCLALPILLIMGCSVSPHIHEDIPAHSHDQDGTILIEDESLSEDDTGDSNTHSDVEDEEIHWSYAGEGGPENWGELEAAYQACGLGKEQSPINLTNGMPTDLANIQFSYEESEITILNNGHAVQVNYDEGSSIVANGSTYNLLQFHFHTPSEHSVGGLLYPAELHLVHANSDGQLAVVGVLVEEGAENDTFAAIWNNLPSEQSEAESIGLKINAADMLPENQIIYRYNGSLTTPPCSEQVLWSVMQDPIEMSFEQISAFSDLFAHDTNRPIQPLNNRTLHLDSSN